MSPLDTTAPATRPSEAIAEQIETQATSVARLEEVIAGAKTRVETSQSRLANLLADSALSRDLPEGEPEQAERELERAKLTLQGLEAERSQTAGVVAILEDRRRAAIAAELEAEQEELARQWAAKSADLQAAAGVLVEAARELNLLLERDYDVAQRRTNLAADGQSARHRKRLYSKLNRNFEEHELDVITRVAAGFELHVAPDPTVKS